MWGAARWLTNGGSSGQTDAAKTPARTASDGESGLAAETSSAITSGGMTGGPEAGRANGHAAAQHEGAVGSHESPGASLTQTVPPSHPFGKMSDMHKSMSRVDLPGSGEVVGRLHDARKACWSLQQAVRHDMQVEHDSRCPFVRPVCLSGLLARVLHCASHCVYAGRLGCALTMPG